MEIKEIIKFDLTKRPMVIFAVIAFFITLICFYKRSLTVLFAVFFILLVPVFIYLRKFALLVPLLITVFIIVNMLSLYSSIDKIELKSKETVSEEFVAISDCRKYDGYSVLELKCLSHNTLPYNSDVSLLYYGGEKVLAGDRFISSVNLSAPNPKYKSTNYGNGTYFGGYIKGEINRTGSDFFYRILGIIRRYVVNSVFDFTGDDTAGLLIAVTLGDKSYLSRELSANIGIAGVSHMIAVSGLHMSILIGNLFKIIERYFKNVYIKLFASIMTVLFFMSVCGFTKSVVRAGLMFLIAAIAPVFNRDSDGLNALAAAVLLVLLVSPFASLSVAFQLSVVSTFAIIYIASFISKKFCELLMIKNKILVSVFEIIFDTVFATIATLPITISIFGRVSLVCIFANLFLNLLVSGALSFNVLALVMPEFILPLRYLLFAMATFCSSAMCFIINGFAEIPFASIKLGKNAFTVSVIVILLVILSVYLLKTPEFFKRRNNADADSL